MEKLSKIKIGGKAYPVKVDLNVLAGIQEVYPTINEFERELLGVRFIKDKNGEQVYTSEGDPAMELVEPSIKAIKTILPLMINEGIAYDAYQKGNEFELLEDMDIIAKVNIDFMELARWIHTEYKKCFEVKKV